MNVEIETEGAQFLEKEYINGIFVAVQHGFRNKWTMKESWVTVEVVVKPRSWPLCQSSYTSPLSRQLISASVSVIHRKKRKCKL
jgi:hypothetical protein